MTTSRFFLLAILLIGNSIPVAAQQSSEDRKIEAELATWREKIDSVDLKIVVLLNRRTEHVLTLSPLKKQLGNDVRDPGRGPSCSTILNR